MQYESMPVPQVGLSGAQDRSSGDRTHAWRDKGEGSEGSRMVRGGS